MKRGKTKTKRKPLAVAVEPVVGRDLDCLLAVAGCAVALDVWMRGNVGHTVEWPIQITASTDADESSAVHMAKLLSDLGKRIRALKRNGPAFRALMGYQARMLYPPNTLMAQLGA